MAKKKNLPANIPNYDNSMLGKLINYVENRDSIGYNNGKWYAPKLKGYDQNQRGMGVDIYTNEYDLSPYLKIDKTGSYLTEEDERKIRHASIQSAEDSAEARYKYARKITGSKKDISPNKHAAVVNAIYNLGTGTVARELFEDKSLMNKLFNASDKNFIQHVNTYFDKHKKAERSKLVNDFFGYKTGGKLTPKKSKIVKNSEILNNTKRDMRKKLVKGTSWPSIKKRIIKKQQGGTLDNEFLDYTNVETPEVLLSELAFDTSDFNPYSYISTGPSKDETPNKISEDTSKLEQVKPVAKKEKSVVRTNITSFDFDPKLGLMGEFVKIAAEEGIPFRVTSGYRPGALTSNGSPSWHSKGLALDIVPKHGVSWEAFQNHFKNSPKTLKWIRDNKFGILDETTPEMLAKTGGTGAHWHIGKDKIAVDSFSKMFPLGNNENT